MIPAPVNNPQYWLLNAPFFALLLLLSICSLSLIIEKLLLLGRWRWHCRKLPAQISLLLKNDQLEHLHLLLATECGAEAILLRKSFHFITHEAIPHKIITNNILKIKLSEETLFKLKGLPTLYQIQRLEQWLEICIEELGQQLEKHCNLFHLIANVSTLLGLLGTVTGMIYAFQNGILEQSTQLAQGISQALITTAGGLIVAIPAIVSQQLFLNSSAVRISTLEQLGHDILLFMHQHLEPLPQQFARKTEQESDPEPIQEFIQAPRQEYPSIQEPKAIPENRTTPAELDKFHKPQIPQTSNIQHTTPTIPHTTPLANYSHNPSVANANAEPSISKEQNKQPFEWPTVSQYPQNQPTTQSLQSHTKPQKNNQSESETKGMSKPSPAQMEATRQELDSRSNSKPKARYSQQQQHQVYPAESQAKQKPQVASPSIKKATVFTPEDPPTGSRDTNFATRLAEFQLERARSLAALQGKNNPAPSTPSDNGHLSAGHVSSRHSDTRNIDPSSPNINSPHIAPKIEDLHLASLQTASNTSLGRPANMGIAPSASNSTTEYSNTRQQKNPHLSLNTEKPDIRSQNIGKLQTASKTDEELHLFSKLDRLNSAPLPMAKDKSEALRKQPKRK